jgi:hypothetical protein
LVWIYLLYLIELKILLMTDQEKIRMLTEQAAITIYAMRLDYVEAISALEKKPKEEVSQRLNKRFEEVAAKLGIATRPLNPGNDSIS